MPHDTDDPVLTTAEAGRRVNRTPRTIIRWANLPKDDPRHLDAIDIGGPLGIPLSALNDCIRRRQHLKRVRKRRFRDQS